MESSSKAQEKIQQNEEIGDDADFYDIMQARYKDMPPRTQEEIEDDINYFVNHPLNAKSFTPEMLDLPEYQALQQLAYEGTPEDVAKNFKVNSIPPLITFVESRLRAFEQSIDEGQLK